MLSKMLADSEKSDSFDMAEIFYQTLSSTVLSPRKLQEKLLIHVSKNFATLKNGDPNKKETNVLSKYFVEYGEDIFFQMNDQDAFEYNIIKYLKHYKDNKSLILCNKILDQTKKDYVSFNTIKDQAKNKGNISLNNYGYHTRAIVCIEHDKKDKKANVEILITDCHQNELKYHYISATSKLPSGTKVRLVRTSTSMYDLKNMQSSAALMKAFAELVIEQNMPVNQLQEFVTDTKYSVGIFTSTLPVVTWPSGHPMLDPKLRVLHQSNEINYFLERIQSFLLGMNPLHNIWPDGAVVRPGPLISAGFIYEGNNTEVICRLCGLESNTADWKRDDDDYAMYVHQQTSSPCSFLERYSYPVNVNSFSNEINANDLIMNQHNFHCYNLVNDDNNTLLVKSKKNMLPITHIINKFTNQISELCLERLICLKNAYKDIWYSCKNIALCWECRFVTELCADCKACFSISDWKCYTFKLRLQNILHYIIPYSDKFLFCHT